MFNIKSLFLYCLSASTVFRFLNKNSSLYMSLHNVASVFVKLYMYQQKIADFTM